MVCIRPKVSGHEKLGTAKEGTVTSEEFASGDWSDRLADELARLAEVQERHLEEINARALGTPIGQANAPLAPSADLFEHLRSFYADVYFGEGHYHDPEYSPLRVALGDVWDALAAHPAFAGVLLPSEGAGGPRRYDELVLRLPDQLGLVQPMSFVGGLMARSLEHAGEGYRTACRELQGLLDPDGNSRAGGLVRGYHVTLFYGLRFEEEVRITENMTICALDRMCDFVNDKELERIAPDIAKLQSRESVAAIVKPFRWKPSIRPIADEREEEPDNRGSFREDAEALVELLSVLHGAPVVSLVTIYDCVDRAAYCLLGARQFHAGHTWGRLARPFDRLGGAKPPKQEALDQARRAFRARNLGHYRAYEPVIARLSEALARRGRFAIDDKILDVAIALERMYDLDRGEIEFKLKTRAACFLEPGSESRLKVFKGIGEFYDARSSIVHKPGRKRKKVDKEAAVGRGFDVARRSLLKLLSEGAPTDWNEIVMGETGSGGRRPGNSAGTTVPGYRNRND